MSVNRAAARVLLAVLLFASPPLLAEEPAAALRDTLAVCRRDALEGMAGPLANCLAAAESLARHLESGDPRIAGVVAEVADGRLRALDEALLAAVQESADVTERLAAMEKELDGIGQRCASLAERSPARAACDADGRRLRANIWTEQTNLATLDRRRGMLSMRSQMLVEALPPAAPGR